MKYLDLGHDWYEGRVPGRFGWNFIEFAARSAGLASVVAAVPLEIHHDYPYAHTNGETIFLPAVYFMPEMYDLMDIKDSQTLAAICAINGSTCHEAYHVLWTVCQMLELPKKFPHLEKLKDYVTIPAFRTVSNIVEDLYIENRGRYDFPLLNPFVEAKNEIFLREEMLERDLALMGIAGPISHGVKIPAEIILGVIHFLKHAPNRAHWFWDEIPEIWHLFMSAIDLDLNQEQRCVLAMQIYELLLEDADPESAEFQADCDADGNALGPTIDEEQQMGMAIAKALEGLMGNKREMQRIEEMYKRAEELDEKSPEYVLIMSDSPAKDISTPKYKEIEPDVGERNINSHPDFKSFYRYFRYMRQQKRTPGIALDHGSKLMKNRLWRISTDGKILSNYSSHELKRGQPELILLLDLSGSTTGVPSSIGRSLFYEELMAAMSAFESMMMARVSCAVYAHTSTRHPSGDYPIVYGIAANNMRLGPSPKLRFTYDYVARFSAASDIDASQNFDGFAIDYVSGLFTSRPGDKVLIVASDGAPLGGMSYSGQPAFDHTVRVVQNVRNRGISVISLSLVESVLKANDKIYAQQFNIRAFGRNMAKSFQAVIAQATIDV